MSNPWTLSLIIDAIDDVTINANIIVKATLNLENKYIQLFSDIGSLLQNNGLGLMVGATEFNAEEKLFITNLIAATPTSWTTTVPWDVKGNTVIGNINAFAESTPATLTWTFASGAPTSPIVADDYGSTVLSKLNSEVSQMLRSIRGEINKLLVSFGTDEMTDIDNFSTMQKALLTVMVSATVTSSVPNVYIEREIALLVSEFTESLNPGSVVTNDVLTAV